MSEPDQPQKENTMAGETPCVLHEGTTNADGYGVLPKPVHGSRLAHRAALAEKLGRPVVGVARHTCDNPPCINKDHLLEGTHADNSDDKVSRGRQRGGRWDQSKCVRGHDLTAPENVQTYERKTTTGTCIARRCVPCRQEDHQNEAARRKAARAAKRQGA